MSIRKIAGLLAGLGLMAGLIGAGVGAQFTASVTANQKINVGTFSCQIVAATPVGGSTVIAADGSSVTYTTPTIMSSVPSSAPFSFTVKNTGSIPQALTVASPSPVTAPWSIINAPFAPVPLAAGAQTTINTGVAWTELDNSDLNASGTFTWTVTCNENLPTAIFDNTPATLPANLPSYGVESSYYNEWGSGVTFAAGPRNLATATVAMSSWACETGSWTDGTCVTTPGDTYNVPITFNIYNVGSGNAVGALLVTQTQTFAIPYRPSYDATHCSGTGAWWTGSVCKNGLAHNITFTFPAGTTLPNSVIFGIAYNTSTNGYHPEGTGNRPENSLNIGVYPETTGNGTTVAVAPLVGTWLPDGLSAYVSPDLPSPAPFAGPVTTFSSDIPPFGGNQPAVQITATY